MWDGGVAVVVMGLLVGDVVNEGGHVASEGIKVVVGGGSKVEKSNKLIVCVKGLVSFVF